MFDTMNTHSRFSSLHCSVLIGLCDKQTHWESFVRLTYRLMDDIKETVRKAAQVASKALHTATVRFCDVTTTSPAKVERTVNLVVSSGMFCKSLRLMDRWNLDQVPLLLSFGINSSTTEIRSATMDQIKGIVKVAQHCIMVVAPKVRSILPP